MRIVLLLLLLGAWTVAAGGCNLRSGSGQPYTEGADAAVGADGGEEAATDDAGFAPVDAGLREAGSE